jgi:hypothetical protein
MLRSQGENICGGSARTWWSVPDFRYAKKVMYIRGVPRTMIQGACGAPHCTGNINNREVGSEKVVGLV